MVGGVRAVAAIWCLVFGVVCYNVRNSGDLLFLLCDTLKKIKQTCKILYFYVFGDVRQNENIFMCMCVRGVLKSVI